jgi:TRAP-type mannitol/chloroaromatic compound transport system permease small subunit
VGGRSALSEERSSPAVLKTVRLIDSFTEWSGKLVAWLILPLAGGVTYEVVARYVFNAPTIWAYDLSYMLYGSLFMLGAAYALLRGAHIRTELFWEGFSDRTKGVIDLTAYTLFFFPGILLLLFASVDEAYHSWQLGERSEQTAWRPILYPFKAVVPLTALLLLIQGISEFLKSLYAARTGRRLSAAGESIQI